MCFRTAQSLANTWQSKLTRHLYLFVILIIWIEFGGELGVQLSGHSKWKTIQHDKSIKDKKRSALFAKLIKDIDKAVAKGSTDPKTNSELARAVTAAQKSNIPAATIKKALDRMELRKKNPKPTYLAFKGPHGVYILVAALTDNAARTKLELKSMAKKYGFTPVLSDPLSPFTTKGWIFAKPPENVTNVAEQALEDAIEAGADEMEPDEENSGNLKFICENSELRNVKSQLEGRNYVIQDAYEMYVARIPVEIPESEMPSVSTLIEEFEDHTEAEKVYTNIA